MAKVPSFQELYARNQAEAEAHAQAERATPASEESCPTITLKDLLGASAQGKAKSAPIALPAANADSLVLCGLSDTLTRTKRPERERPRRK